MSRRKGKTKQANSAESRYAPPGKKSDSIPFKEFLRRMPDIGPDGLFARTSDSGREIVISEGL